MKNKMIKILFMIGLPAFVLGQETLTIEDAIKISLEKNYAVLISSNDQKISAEQNNLGNAGMSPTVSVNANLNLANINSHQEFSTGTIQDRNGANSNVVGASVNVNWMVFDGLKMFAVKKRLNETEQLSAFQLKQQMEMTVYNVILAYYDIVRIETLIKAAKQNLSIYEESKKIAQTKMEVGSDSKVDFLLTQTNENVAKSNLLQLELQWITAKTNLNTLLARPADIDFKMPESFEINYEPALDELKKTTLSNNTSLLISRQNELITQQTIKEARSVNLPYIQLNGAYNFNRSQSQAGIVFLSQQKGLNYGVTAGMLFFNGNKNNKLVKERQIRLLSQKYLTEQTKQNVDALVYINYQTFITNKKILLLEKQNLDNAQEVLQVSMERYKLGKANLLETIQTQKNLEDAQSRYVNALYNTKRAETELLKANGSLIK